MADLKRQKELTDRLKEASKAYYADDTEIMSNYEYDELYDELKALEEESGTVLTGSPTANVGYEAVDSLPREAHESPMLSLDKTKDREALRSWLNGHEALLSWKLDGLTIVLTYRDGSLFKAVTRGNGEVGEVITNNARTFINLPLKIPFKGELILRGEAVISYADFERINGQIDDVQLRYKNPRNLCSGSVRQLNNEITAKRNVRFYAFAFVSARNITDDGQLSLFGTGSLDDEILDTNSQADRFGFLKDQGFEVVEFYRVNEDNILERIEYYSEAVKDNPIPSDGLVLLYDDIAYGRSLGRTAKFPRDAIAFKWQDEIRETELLDIEWSPSRTGLINPVAVFDPVELEGTTVSRASVHNVSIVRQLKLGIGDRIKVYKANMIIPQIAENLTGSGNASIPDTCPSCKGETRISSDNDVETLICINPQCPAKQIKSFTLFVSRNAMKIDGMSEATLEKFIARGFVHEFADIYRLSDHKDEICNMEGFGEKSYEKIRDSIERSRTVLLPNLIYALGILNVGLSNAKMICRSFDQDIDRMINATSEELSGIEGVGPVIAESFTSYFADPEKMRQFKDLIGELDIVRPEAATLNENITGKTFVITGSLEHFENRNALKEAIEQAGGRVAGSVSIKTDFLVNNDMSSGSSKNRKARELNIPVIDEDEMIRMLQGG